MLFSSLLHTIITGKGHFLSMEEYRIRNMLSDGVKYIVVFLFVPLAKFPG